MTVVKHYTAVWCGPCRAVKPILEDIARQNATIRYSVIDIDANPEAAQAAGIRSIPVVIVEKNGVETSRIIGAQSRTQYESVIL
jgi:thioredoxin 1